MNQTSYELVRQGVSLALEAHRRGLLDDRVLDAILQYYDAEGAVEPFPPAEVLERLGGLTAAQVRELLGAPARTPSDVQGQRFGDRLTLLEPLGAGGMGMVYRAYDRVLKRAVAVKRLRTDHLDKAGAGRVLARFEREAMAMARVRHPACVQIFDAGLTPAGEPYLVMELVTGRSLREVIEDDRARAGLEARRVAQWGAALADALQACHDVGLIHRDVKPANILLDAAGNPRLTDFGVALDDQARTRLTADRGMVGTLAYMSPEQAMGGAVDARSDVYALGATLYEVLTGSPPFDGPGAAVLLRQVLTEEPAPVRRRRPGVPADLETIVHTCLAKSVADRYATAQALALDLRRFLADEPVLARATSPGRRLARRVWRARRPLAAALLVSALAGAGLLATRVRARAVERARIDAALDAAAVASDLDAAEAAVLPLVAIAAPDQAERAREALRGLRGRRRLLEAEAAFDRWRAALALGRECLAEADGLKARIEPQRPFAESPDKQRLLEVETAHARAERDALAALFDFERALGQAALDAPPAEVDGLRARVLLARGRGLEDDDPAAAEALYREAAEADVRSGGALAGELARPVVEVRSEKAAECVLSRFEFDPTVARMVPREEVRGPTPARFEASGAGEYLIEVIAEGCLPVRDLVILTRGGRREFAYQPIERASLGPLADMVVHIPAGVARWGERLHERAVVEEDYLLMRDELAYEVWHSFVATSQSTAIRPPYLPRRNDRTVTLRRDQRRTWPIAGVNLGEIRALLNWLQLELDLADIPLRTRLPAPEEFHRALRGEFAWRFPWGRRFDGSFCETENAIYRPEEPIVSRLLRNVDHADVSSFGVQRLVGRVGEFVQLDEGLASVGGHYLLSPPTVHDKLHMRAEPEEHADEIKAPSTGLRPAFSIRAYSQHSPSREPSRLGQPESPSSTHDEQDVRGALRQASEGVRRAPKHAEAWNARGTARLHLDDLFGAAWDFSVAHALAPNASELLCNRGFVNLARGDASRALGDFLRCTELSPELAAAWLGGCQARHASGDNAGARRDLERATLLLGPAHPAVVEVRQILDQRRD